MATSWVRNFLLGAEVGAIGGLGLVLSLAIYTYFDRTNSAAVALLFDAIGVFLGLGAAFVGLLAGTLAARNSKALGPATGSGALGSFLGFLAFFLLFVAALLVVTKIAPGPAEADDPDFIAALDYSHLARFAALSVPAAVVGALTALSIFATAGPSAAATHAHAGSAPAHVGEHAPAPTKAAAPAPPPAPPPMAPPTPSPPQPPPAGYPQPYPMPQPYPAPPAYPGAYPGAAMPPPVATLTCPRCRMVVPAYKGLPTVSCPQCGFTGPNPMA